MGRVLSLTGVPVPYKTVTWGGLCPIGATPGSTLTDAGGWWTSPALANGQYSVTVGGAPCAHTVYLCDASNTRTTINNADAIGVDFVHDVATIHCVVSVGGSLTIGLYTITNPPALPAVVGTQDVIFACGASLNIQPYPNENYTLSGFTVDGVPSSNLAYAGAWLYSLQGSHTVTAAYTYVPPPPPPTTGACCFPPTYSCSQLTEPLCSQAAGYFFGLGSPCDGAHCYAVPAVRRSWGSLKAIYR